jgi:hypothetical protein
MCLFLFVSPIFDFFIAIYYDKTWVINLNTQIFNKKWSFSFLAILIFTRFIMDFLLDDRKVIFCLISSIVFVILYSTSLFLSKMGGIDVYLLNVVDKCIYGEVIDFYPIRNKLKEIIDDYKRTPSWLLVLLLWILVLPFLVAFVAFLFLGELTDFPVVMFTSLLLVCLLIVVHQRIVRYAVVEFDLQFELVFNAVQSTETDSVQNLRKIIERRLNFTKIILLVIPAMYAMGFQIIYGLL